VEVLRLLLVLFFGEAGRSRCREIKVSPGMDSWAEMQTQEY